MDFEKVLVNGKIAISSGDGRKTEIPNQEVIRVLQIPQPPKPKPKGA